MYPSNLSGRHGFESHSSYLPQCNHRRHPRLHALKALDRPEYDDVEGVSLTVGELEGSGKLRNQMRLWDRVLFHHERNILHATDDEMRNEAADGTSVWQLKGAAMPKGGP